MRAFLGLGSNLGDRLGYLRDAVTALSDLAEVAEVTAVSPIYETSPVGGPVSQPSFLNLVVELSTEASPRQLLELAQTLEAAAGRIRTVADGPRSLDVDVLLVGEHRVVEADLVVPHPRMHQRRFVLAPLADLAPELVPPDWQETAAGTAVRFGRLWRDERHR